MNRSHFWKLIFIILVVLWSLWELNPPTGRDLVQEFRGKAIRPDATFTNILSRLDGLQKERPARPFANLVEAVGTNSVTKYFPEYGAENEPKPTLFILNRLQKEAAGKIKLGLDLQGGTSFLVEMETNRLARIDMVTNSVSGAIETVTNRVEEYQVKGAIDQAVEVLRKRVDRFGVAEPQIQPAGNNRILIQLPGLSEEDRELAKANIQKVAYLEFRMVHEKSDDLIAEGSSAPGYEILKEVRVDEKGERTIKPYLVRKRPDIIGGIKHSFVSRDNMGRPEIMFTFDSKNAEIFARLTRENVGRLLAIVLDGELQSAPVIQTAIEGGSGQITGSFTDQEAFDLANVLENPLEAPVHIISSDDVDPSLGRDSIQSGLKAAIIGTIAVAGFMLIYYLLAGVVANIALILNIIILFGLMFGELIPGAPFTLTMPGIAAIVLTIGMAVDANVLIFERIREELAAGKSLRGAVNAGYSKAFGTIFDSNLTTLISSLILYFMGTGPVKGFGIALTIGVCVSMFTALVVTRLIFDFLLAKNWIKSLPMLHILRGTKIDFMKYALPAFAASWMLILIGNGYGIFGRGKDLLGVEFSGGNVTTYSFSQKVETDKLRAALEKLHMGEPRIQYQKNISTGKDTLSVTVRVLDEKASAQTGNKVRDLLVKEFPQAGLSRIGESLVGPTVGREIQKMAVIAALLALFGILVYVAFRYEFSFALGAIIAIIHDLAMTAGWFFLTGGQMSGPWVAAMLTIIGFSINDTIVIFDRIREDLKLGVRGTFREVMNQALNQTLSRTIITSGTVFLATMSLYIFGGGVVNDFAFTFLVGILTGTYSSIFIASAFVLWWHKGQRPHLGSGVTMQEQSAAARV